MNRIFPGQLVVVFLLAALGCGSKGSGRPPEAKGSGAPLVVVEAPLPAVGVEDISAFNYIYGKGSKDYDQAVKASKETKNAKPDWAAVKASAEAAIAADPNHAGAHFLLAIALVQLDDAATAIPHFEFAVAQDALSFTTILADDPRLTAFLATPMGKTLAARAEQLRLASLEVAHKGALLIGRRSTFKYPNGTGPQSASPRGEVYALDVAANRFVRLTHTNHTVAGMITSPDGSELATIGFDKAQLVPPAEPLLTRAWVETFATESFVQTGKRVKFAAARAVGVAFGAGGQLRVATFGSSGSDLLNLSSVDRSTGKLAKAAGDLELPRLMVNLDEAYIERPQTNVMATWSGTPLATSALQFGKSVLITIPESGKTNASSIAVSADNEWLAFATSADACTADAAAPSLYTVETSGKLHHILTAKSRFGSRWLSGNQLIYEDGAGGLRIWDSASRREIAAFKSRAGLALDGLSASPRPRCRPEDTLPGEDSLNEDTSKVYEESTNYDEDVDDSDTGGKDDSDGDEPD